MRHFAFIGYVLFFWAKSATAGLVLNEVLYDPPGSDGDAEFVELFNSGDRAQSLDGVRLLFINGAAPDTPREIWQAPPGLLVAPGAFYLLGGAEVPEADAVVALSLQNGPDAVWLARGELVLDRLAYGPLDSLGEGSPAPDLASQSLGRIPDGNDSDDNLADWHGLNPPSPGRPNARPHQLRAQSIDAEPPWRGAAGLVRLRASLIADGYLEQQRARIRWIIDRALQRQREQELARGATGSDEIELWFERGRHELQLSVENVDGGIDSLRAYLQIGPGPVALNEVMARPASDEPEWVELIVLDDGVDSLDGWAIADATRDARQLPRGLNVQRGQLLLLTADPDALRRFHTIESGIEVHALEGAWPTLNNSGAGGDPADEVLLYDAEGVVVDLLRYDDRLSPVTGRSIERGLLSPDAPQAWYPAPGGASPGRANDSAVSALPDRGLALDPNPFSPDGDGHEDFLHVLLRGEGDLGATEAAIYDLAGDRVRALGEDSGGGSLRQWIWDGRDARGRPVQMGAYVVVVRSDERSAAGGSWRALVALGRRQ